MKTLDESLKETFEILLDANSGRKLDGIATGYQNFDDIVQGLRKGTATIITSRPALGKTAFALNIVNNLIKCPQQTVILYCSDLSNTELTSRLLTIASGVEKHFGRNHIGKEMQRLTEVVEKIKNYSLYFSENNNIDDEYCSALKTLHSEKKFDLLIADNCRPDECRKFKALAKELDIAVLILTDIRSQKDELISRSSADTFITLHRERKADYDPDLGAPVDFIVSKNTHGLCGTCRMYFIPEIMLFKESCIGEPFVTIPNVYEPVTPYGELKKYLSPEKLPLLASLRSEIPQEDEVLNLSDILRLSACFEAVGDHENAVKVFLLGRKNCYTYETGAVLAYDWMFAAGYYWIFKDQNNADRCMKQAGSMLNDKHIEEEFRELRRRMRNYVPVEWIKDEEIN